MPVLRLTALRLTTLAALGLAGSALLAQPRTAAGLGRAILEAGLDTTQCYRVRDLTISAGDARFFLTSGYIIFGKPVNGAPVSAAFSTEAEGGDAEVLLLPPGLAERKSLASYTGTPNLDEHFTDAIFLFTEQEARGLERQIRSSAGARNSPEVGELLANRWSPVLTNLASGFESRMVLDLLNAPAQGTGFLEAVIQGKKLGNFEVGFDSRSSEQINAGQVQMRNGAAYFNTWTSFASRSQPDAAAPAPEEQILSYRIEATLDPAFVLHCVTRIRIRATAQSRNVIPLNLSSQMRATAATVDGAPAEAYERDSIPQGLAQDSGDELLLIVPQHPLEPGSEHEVEIQHAGRVIEDTGHQVYFVGSRGSWYPDRDAQFATYDATFRYPKSLNLVSAGEITEDRTEGDVRITRRVPKGRIRVLAFNLGVYQSKLLARGGIQIDVSANREVEDALRYRAPDPEPVRQAPAVPARRSFVPPVMIPQPMLQPTPVANPVDRLAEVAGDIGAAFDFYRARFGEPPLDRLEVSPVPGRFGQGFAGMIYLSTLSYLPPNVRPLSLMPQWQQAFYGELIRAHETAHQWWGNIVTTGGYHDEWLMEALANYSALLFLEHHKGAKFAGSLLDAYRAQLLAKGPDGETAESEGPVVQGRRLANSNNPNAWTAVMYGKGMWIMHMLRRRMGDAQFLKMLAELRRRYEWKTISTGQFRQLCAEFLPPHSPDPKLENFFDEWVYGTGVPALKLTYSVKGAAGAWKLNGTITQSGVPDDFNFRIPVEIQTGRARVMRVFQTSSDPVTFSIPVASARAKAVLDPASSVLRR